MDDKIDYVEKDKQALWEFRAARQANSPPKPWSKGDIVRGADDSGLGARPFQIEHEPFIVPGVFCKSNSGDILFPCDEYISWAFSQNEDARKYVRATRADVLAYIRVTEANVEKAENERVHARSMLYRLRYD